jgi:putative addiction module component (TIGR02574 family)
MSPTAEHLYQSALALPEAERIELVEALLAAASPDSDPPFDESWREVIHRRSAEIDAGTVKMIPLEETQARAHRMVGLDG